MRRNRHARADRGQQRRIGFLEVTTAAKKGRLNPIDIQTPALIAGRQRRIGFLEVTTATKKGG